MAKIRVDQIGDYVQNRLEALLRAAVLETDSLLKQASPVDTGRFRASWQVGENAAGFYDAGLQQETTGAFKDQSKAPGKPEPPPLRKMNYGQERVGNIYSVHNNLPYAEPLANGSSKQTAGAQGGQAGWVQGAAKDVQGRVLKAAAGIGRTYTRNRQ
jgi:hypothetical protein